MIVLGMTSYGNKIYIDWELDPNGKRVPIFPIFKNEIETYQTWTVFEVLLLEKMSKKFPVEQTVWLRQGFKFYESQLLTNPIQKDDIETHLGIVNAFQRARYARIFIRSEFQRNSG